MKKNLLAIFLFIALFYTHAQAQDPTILWAGSATSQVTPGNQIINNTSAITTDVSGNVFVTGYFYGTTDFDFGPGTTNLTSAGSTDIFLAKYDASGNFLWAKSIGGSGDDAAYSMVSNGSNVIITGTYTGTVDFDPGPGFANLSGSGLHNSFIAEFDGSGNLTLARGLTGPDVYSSAITRDLSGNIYIAGYFQGTVDFDPATPTTANLTSAGLQDAFVAKYNSLGGFVWVRSMGGAGYEGINAINLDPSGNIYLAGSFGSTSIDFATTGGTTTLTRTGYYDCFLTKFDKDGNCIWANGMGGPGGVVGSSTYPRSLASDISGVYITGSFNGTVDFDPSASTANITTAGSSDVFIARYNNLGAYVWAKNIAGSGPDEVSSITTDSKSNIYITGQIGGVADFDPGPGLASISPSGFDIYMAKYDVTGNYIWAKNFGSSSNSDNGTAITIDGSDNLYLAGTFTQAIDFDPGPSVTELTTNPVGVVYNGDVFVAKYTSGNLLPVQLTSFTAQAIAKSVQLTWTTANEANNQKFIVQRSTNGIHFSQIAEAAGKGTTATENNYSVYDLAPVPAINYYRLKQVDADGKFAYSKIINIDFTGSAIISIYPNPSSLQVNVQYNASSYQTVQLISTDGKILASNKAGAGAVQFNVRQLPAGVYYIRLSGTAGTVNKKIIKQ